MRSYARIFYSKDNSDTFFAGEYKRLYEATPRVALAVDKLFCAVAASGHAEALAQTEFFPQSIVSLYKNGGIYTDVTTPLFEEECSRLLELQSISYDTVTVTLDKKTDTVTNILTEMAAI